MEMIKRGYYLTLKLVEAWEHFHRPSKDYSPSAAGAFLIWMVLSPQIREQARRAACGEIDLEAVRAMLMRGMLDAQLLKLLVSQSISVDEAAVVSQAREILFRQADEALVKVRSAAGRKTGRRSARATKPA